jgi:hypothetical protein
MRAAVPAAEPPSATATGLQHPSAAAGAQLARGTMAAGWARARGLSDAGAEGGTEGGGAGGLGDPRVSISEPVTTCRLRRSSGKPWRCRGGRCHGPGGGGGGPPPHPPGLLRLRPEALHRRRRPERVPGLPDAPRAAA